MSYVVHGCTTVIVDVGSEYTKMGYCGDFHPKVFQIGLGHSAVHNSISISSEILSMDKISLESPAVSNSIIKSPESIISIIESSPFKHDSIIMVAHTSESESTIRKTLRILFDKTNYRSAYIIRSSVCELFGVGRTSGTVVSFSAGSLTVSTIVNGGIVEFFKSEKGGQYLDSLIYEELSKRIVSLEQETINTSTIRGYTKYIKEYLLTFPDKVDLSEVSQSLSNISLEIFLEDFLSEVYNVLDRMVELRSKYKLDKKNTLSSMIVFTGGLLRSKQLFDKCKAYLSEKHIPDVAESIIYDTTMDQCFTGASVFGMNDMAKCLYLTSNDIQAESTKIGII